MKTTTRDSGSPLRLQNPPFAAVALRSSLPLATGARLEATSHGPGTGLPTVLLVWSFCSVCHENILIRPLLPVLPLSRCTSISVSFASLFVSVNNRHVTEILSSLPREPISLIMFSLKKWRVNQPHKPREHDAASKITATNKGKPISSINR